MELAPNIAAAVISEQTLEEGSRQMALSNYSEKVQAWTQGPVQGFGGFSMNIIIQTNVSEAVSDPPQTYAFLTLQLIEQKERELRE